MNCRKFIEILSALVLISGVSSNTQSEDGKAKENHPVCRSQQCIQRGKLLKEFIDGDKDPCGDFFSYACGGWIKTHEKKQQPYDVFQYVRSGFTEDMAEILAQTGPSDTTSSVTLKAAKLYKACMEWPKPYKSQTQAASDYKDVLKIGLGPILSYFVARGATEVNKHVIKIFMLSIMNAATKERVKAAVKFMNEKITDDDAETISTKLEEFERKLLQIRIGVLRSDRRPQAMTTTFGKLEKEAPDFPLLEVLNKDFKKADVTLTNDDNVEIFTADMYKKTVEFLKESDATTLHNYLGFYILLGLADFAFTDFLNPVLNVKPPRKEKCVSFVYNGLKEVATYMYAKRNVPLEAKNEVEDIFDKLRNAFLDALENSTPWLSEKTRSEAKNKVNKLTAKIGYPNWLMNLTHVEEIYKEMEEFPHGSTFMQMMQTATEYKDKMMMKKLRLPYEKDKDWMFSPSTVTAFYNPSLNELVYPVGGLRAPFYSHGLPKSLNFGAIGAVMAHEITHSITGKGITYNSDGNQITWWDASDTATYRKKVDCFIQKYKVIVDEKANMSLDGTKTVDENIADSVGLEMAYNAYNKLLGVECNKPASELQGLNDLWGRQLFFASYAWVWCDVSNEAHTRMKITSPYIPHSPNKYRVNVPTSNFEAFAQAFHCTNSENSRPKKSGRCEMF
uniref:Endothelin-converting enzyme n=1 Tax=Rhipicephalus appendiculatus TaxID=34631 RepID=A0A131Z5P6_RHIAP